MHSQHSENAHSVSNRSCHRKKNPIQPKYIGIPQAAIMLSVDSSTLYRMIAAGELPAYRIGTKRLLICIQELEAFMNARRTLPAEDGLFHVGQSQAERR
jgi:excisionase family DNA binding protein